MDTTIFLVKNILTKAYSVPKTNGKTDYVPSLLNHYFFWSFREKYNKL